MKIDTTIKDEVYAYLEELRESGETNMWGAGAYLEEEFSFTEEEAGSWLRAWNIQQMGKSNTFSHI